MTDSMQSIWNNDKTNSKRTLIEDNKQVRANRQRQDGPSYQFKVKDIVLTTLVRITSMMIAPTIIVWTSAPAAAAR